MSGEENAHRVYELNRLWFSNDMPKNSESRFIGWVLRELPKDLILVSYADTKYGHIGKVYQATNWIFTGTSIPFTDYTKNGLDHRSIPKEERIKENMDKVTRSIKNRYVYFLNGDSSQLKWKRLPYLSQTKGGSSQMSSNTKPSSKINENELQTKGGKE